MNPAFWHGKKVFLTGHTGFKGSWLSLWLQQMGAHVTGYALPPETSPNLFTIADVARGMESIFGNILDVPTLTTAIQKSQPDIVLHLAAQPLVRLSYEEPVQTFATNVMGTINVLEATRSQKSIRSIVVVTTDKCYENREWVWGYRETEAMGGHDPYSASKGCAELVTAAYRNSFLSSQGVGLASARAGNVIGGGDWAKDRLVPDILNAINQKTNMLIRNPQSTRPWQHVLEPLAGYLVLAEKLFNDPAHFASAWNFGPAGNDVRPVQWIVDRLAEYCQTDLTCEQMPGNHPHEAHFLSLDSTKARTYLQWEPRWTLDQALEKIADWHQAYCNQQDMRMKTLEQIADYSAGCCK